MYKAKYSYLFLIFLFIFIYSQTSYAEKIQDMPRCGESINNWTELIHECSYGAPDFLEPVYEPLYGSCYFRATSPELEDYNNAPIYSQLQAWNSDMSKILLINGYIINTEDYSINHRISGKRAMRWSPQEPNIIYHHDTNKFMKYNISSKESQIVREFSEYTELDAHSSWEEISLNLKTLLMGTLSNGTKEIFIYDIINDNKSNIIIGNPTINGNVKNPDWFSMSPLGTYAMVQWCGGGEGNHTGLWSYDLEMNKIGKVYPDCDHSDLAVDSEGVEWYVTYTHSDYTDFRGPYVIKSRLPKGFEDWRAGDDTAVKYLQETGRGVGGHISCQGRYQDFCVMKSGRNVRWGWQPFTAEVYMVYLDSEKENQHVERLLHHMSYIEGSTVTVSPDGTQVLFSSRMNGTGRIDSYIIQLTQDDERFGDDTKTIECILPPCINNTEMKSSIMKFQTDILNSNDFLLKIIEWKKEGCIE